jgi:hypothetical protein
MPGKPHCARALPAVASTREKAKTETSVVHRCDVMAVVSLNR